PPLPALLWRSAASAGFEYAPLNPPPAGPDGGYVVGAPVTFPHATLLTLASVTAPSASFAVVTARSCKWAVNTAPSASSRGPTASAASFALVTEPSFRFAVSVPVFQAL